MMPRLPSKLALQNRFWLAQSRSSLPSIRFATKPIFSVYSINYTQLPVKIYAVQPSDWPAFKQYLREWQQTNPPPQPVPGRLVADKTLRPEAATDILTQVDIDLSEYMDGNFGQFIIIVEPPKGLFESSNDKWKRYSQTIHAWVQITQIGLDAFNDYNEMTVWATALKNGAPLAGVTVQPGSVGNEVTTAEDGTAKLAVPVGSTYLVARLGSDQALLPRSTYAWSDDSWYSYPPNDELRWYVFDDRQMYRPGRGNPCQRLDAADRWQAGWRCGPGGRYCLRR